MIYPFSGMSARRVVSYGDPSFGHEAPQWGDCSFGLARSWAERIGDEMRLSPDSDELKSLNEVAAHAPEALNASSIMSSFASPAIYELGPAMSDAMSGADLASPPECGCDIMGQFASPLGGGLVSLQVEPEASSITAWCLDDDVLYLAQVGGLRSEPSSMVERMPTERLRSVAKMAFNSGCYVWSMNPDTSSPSSYGETRGMRKLARRLEQLGVFRVQIGQKYETPEMMEALGLGGGLRSSPRAHVVRGHWHNYWVGSGAEKKRALRWVDMYLKGARSTCLIGEAV